MSLKDSCVSAWEALPVTIASGSSITSTINLGGLRISCIAVPSAWTTANMTFQASPDGGTTWYDLKDQNGNEISVAASVSSYVVLSLIQFSSMQYLRVRSGTSSAPIVQAEERSLLLILRSV